MRVPSRAGAGGNPCKGFGVVVDIEVLRRAPGKSFDHQALAGFLPTGGSIDRPVERYGADAWIGKPRLRNLQNRKTSRGTQKFVDVDQEYSVCEEPCRRQGLFVELELKASLSAPVKA